MAVATHAQEARRTPAGRRVLAALASVWLVAFGLFATRHEAEVAHVVDPQTGQLVHASRLAGPHTGQRSDVHGAVGHADHGACAILNALHQAASPPGAGPALAAAPGAAAVVTRTSPRDTAARASVYRLAPKTSPPVRA